MIVAPITFPWVDNGPYAWTPKRERDGSIDYWKWAWDHLQWGGCNASIMLMSDVDHFARRNRNQSEVLYERSIPIIPYWARAGFVKWGWKRANVPPDAELVADHMGQVLNDSSSKPVDLVTYKGKIVMGFLGTKVDHVGWPEDFLYEVTEAIKGFEIYWLVDRHTSKRLRHDGQVNVFTMPRHYWVSSPTAAVRPGVLHGKDPYGHRFVPRDRGKWFRKAIRSVLKNDLADMLFIESEGEYMEGTSILPCNTRQNEPARSVHKDRWGVGPRRYLRILRRELKRAGKWEETLQHFSS